MRDLICASRLRSRATPSNFRYQSLHFHYSDAFEPLPEAYETLLLDVLKGDPTLFVRDDWVEDSWRLYTPLIKNRPPVHPYAAGTWGPAEADRLVEGFLPDGWTES